MKKAVSYFVVSCLIGAWLFSPANFLSSSATAATPSALISGTVRDDAGKPLGGALVALFAAQPGQLLGGQLLKNAVTDGAGNFTVNIAPGFYRLRAVADGFRPTFTLITLDAANKITHNFALRRVGTIIEKRGDKGDYRWIGRSVPRSILHYQEEEDFDPSDTPAAAAPKPESDVHGIAQLTHVQAGDADFTGANFAVSSSFGGAFEVALVGQIGTGTAAPQRLTAIASLRPQNAHQITTALSYGQISVRQQKQFQQLEQFSFGVLDEWQVSKPLLLIFGVDYSTFGRFGSGRDSVLPRFAVQYTPHGRTRINAGITPGTSELQPTDLQTAPEGLRSENIEANFVRLQPDVALMNGAAMADRSRRLEFGVEHAFSDDGDSALEATAFYDVISNHGVGVLALPLEASPENQVAFQQVARQMVAMNGAARGVRVMYTKRLNSYLQTTIGYSVGRGAKFSGAELNTISPAQLFTGANFQVASAKLDLDLTQQTGTRISTVVRLSPTAVIFAIDPFAGRMSVYDPNISIYVTQALPTFGLPVKCQALVDLRNLLNQPRGVSNEKAQLVAAQMQRSVRGAISFQW